MKHSLRSNRRIALCIVLVLLFAAWAAPAAQAAVTPWSLTQLTLSADLIVRGRIAWQSSHWDDEKTVIYTISTLAVTDQIKGHGGHKLLAIKTPGGVVGKIGLTVSPAAHFVPGEEVLVFLEKLDADVYAVTGSIQGKYTVRDGWAVNEEMGTAMPLIPFVRRILAIMEAHGLVSALPSDWAPASRRPQPAHPGSSSRWVLPTTAFIPNDIAGIRYIYPAACLSDFDGDGFVTLDDIAEITTRWRLKATDPWPPGSERYDLNEDKVINIVDVMIAVTEMDGPC